MQGLRCGARMPSPAALRASTSPPSGRGGTSIARAASLALIVCCIVATAALALTFPQLTGRVVDEAGILNEATRAELTKKLADLEAKTTDQLVVVTLKSLQGTSIEDFGYQLGRHWGIGQKGKNNGALLIVAPTERKVRFEVGYGLEGKLTDAVTKLIIEGGIIPRFRANDFPGGITRGVDDIIQILTGDPGEWQRQALQRNNRDTSAIEFIIMLTFMAIAGFIVFGVVSGVIQIVHGMLAAFGLAPMKPKKGFWYWVNRMPAGGFSSSSGSSSGSSWGSSSSSSSGGFSGGGGSFGGGGSSGSW
jgi:uncharacterized protein